MVEAKVPFDFVVHGKTLPAGDYLLERDDNQPALLFIRGKDGAHTNMIVLTEPAGDHDPAGDQPALRFTRRGSEYWLADVWRSRNEGWEIEIKSRPTRFATRKGESSMRINATRFLLAATLAIVPAVVFAAAPPAKAPAKATTSHSPRPRRQRRTTPPPAWSSRSTPPLSPSPARARTAGEMRFVLNPSTKRDGKIEVGAPVSVRYREDGASHVATAISAQHAKPQSTSKKP